MAIMPEPIEITIRNYRPKDADDIYQLQLRYAEVCPGAVVVPGAAYNGPNFERGRNIFCAVATNDQIIGYAPMYPIAVTNPSVQAPHTIWTEVKLDPSVEHPRDVKDLLFGHVLERAKAIRDSLSKDRRTRLALEYEETESAAVDYALSKGFTVYESVFRMSRDLTDPIPDIPIPEDVEIQSWRMESLAEQAAYVEAKNQAFPDALVTVEQLQYFMTSPLWAVGTSISACAWNRIIGSVMVYWDEKQNREKNESLGYTEEIFVIPEWAGRGVARAMIARSLAYLKEHGMTEARLQVKSTNTRAIAVYKSLGYVPIGEKKLLEMYL